LDLFSAAALGRDIDVDLVALDHVDMQHAGRVVARVAAGEGRIGQHLARSLLSGLL
jgi:hypothetical protein